jgi:calcineurin-like phosphoesterase family protein
MIWFTADTHFGHRAIRHYCGRPFESMAEMNDVMVANWNAVVQPKDIVYHLGDFGFGSPDYLHKIAQRLRGSINLILGNHDRRAHKPPFSDRFGFIKDVHMMKTQIHGRTQQIFLSHYAHRTWAQWNYGTWHLFGHSHGNMPPLGKSFDVGVDCWNFTPISIDFVEKQMLLLEQKDAEQKELYKGKSYEERQQEILEDDKKESEDN